MLSVLQQFYSILTKTMLHPAQHKAEQGQQEIGNTIRAVLRSSQKRSPLRASSREGLLPLSFGQQRLLFLEWLAPHPVNNLPAAYRLVGQLDMEALVQSLNEIVRRHEVLRTTFSFVDGQAAQVILPQLTLTLPVTDIGALPLAQQQAEARQQILAATQPPFDLTQSPLLRVKLLKLSETEHILVLVLHHIIFDEWSFHIFMRELCILYETFAQSEPSPLPELPYQYADFAMWQRQWLKDEGFESHLNYWKQQLAGTLPVLQLPTDRLRPPIRTYQGAHQSIELPLNLTSALKVLSQRAGVTLFVTLLATFKILLYRYSGQADICVGTPITGRNRTEIEGLIGCFINTLVLRTNLDGNPSFSDLLNRVQQVAVGAYAHQDLPFETLVEELQPERNLSHSLLFQVMFILQNFPRSDHQLAGLRIDSLPVDNQMAQFDLTLWMCETDRGLTTRLEYNSDLFDPSTIIRMLGHFQILLEGIVASPDRHLSELPLLTPAEQQQILFEWNHTQTDDRKTCIHQLFEAQVERTPEAIAIVFEHQQLTYRELNHRANQLAHYLQHLGVVPEMLVGICVERSLEMLVGLLGILKAGGAYVPLDPSYPPARLSYMLADAAIEILLTQQELLATLPPHSARVVCLNPHWGEIDRFSSANLATSVCADRLAYAIYTSGSTGRPKGVQIDHRSLTNCLSSISNLLKLTHSDTFYAISSISFDMSVLELYLPLTIGAKVVLGSREVTTDPDRLLSELSNAKISVLQATPATWQMLLAAGWSDNYPLKVICGGEALSAKLADRILATGSELWNLYGPTEATIWSTAYQLGAKKTSARTEADGSCEIVGRPIANTQIYILDRHLKPVPIGVTGELYIGGSGLARGYLNRPDLTLEKFIPNPFSPATSVSLYKTGDLARYFPTGEIEYIGRIDQQVKIRGFRIELGEIEALLNAHPQIQQSIVIARSKHPSDRFLVAYLTLGSTQNDHSSIEQIELQQPELTDNLTINLTDWNDLDSGLAPATISNRLRQFLAQKLPRYMIPAEFIILESFPLTPNGKVDRRLLPEPKWIDKSREKTVTDPRTLTEEMLAQIWAEALGFKFLDWGKSQIDIYSNFFELGGHSLVAALVIARIRAVFQIEMPLQLFFKFPTIAGLAEQIETEQRTSGLLQPRQLRSSLVPIQSSGSNKPFFLVPGGNGGEEILLFYPKLVYLLGQQQPVYSFRARGWDGIQTPHPTVEAMAADYIQEMRIIQPDGPYLLGGDCVGGAISLEMAQQLIATGQKVGLLVLIDTVVPTGRRELTYYIEQFFQIPRIHYHLSKLRLRSGREYLTYIFDRALTVKEKFTKNRYHVAKVGRNYERITNHYRAQVYSGKITFLTSESFTAERKVQEWNQLTTGGLEVHQLTGNHDSYLGKNVETTAEKLQICLNTAQTD
jgi:amino acid adenylation domain-containing protein